ncbi:alginate lyase family protein [Paenibacillus sp. N3.4]|nr:alginate lyase family protein [Paenibacillus sp. N3.4]
MRVLEISKEYWKHYFDIEGIVREAEESLQSPMIQITDQIAPRSSGGIHDYYSNGDYWWPDPDTEDGLPYVRRDGESNPGNFGHHRSMLRLMRTHVAKLASAYRITKDERYAAKAVQLLKSFFLDEWTRMNPHLLYAQAVPGVCHGRGIGIIDTLHLIDITVALEALQGALCMEESTRFGLVEWFSSYLQWMSTHHQGIEERDETNNHGICWFVQAAAFAQMNGDQAMLAYCKEQFKTRLLPEQMDVNGSLPRELARTKPYAYAIFALDNLVTLCHILSTPDDNLWEYQLSDGRGVRKGIDFLLPYLERKSEWPYRQDVEHFAEWPVGMSFLLFTGLAYESDRLVNLWRMLDKNPANSEVRRNMAIRQPLLWL